MKDVKIYKDRCSRYRSSNCHRMLRNAKIYGIIQIPSMYPCPYSRNLFVFPHYVRYTPTYSPQLIHNLFTTFIFKNHLAVLTLAYSPPSLTSPFHHPRTKIILNIPHLTP